MKIVEKELSELIPYENNPRKNEEAVEYVANSIKEFGFKVPVVIDKDNVIVAGHTRCLAAKQLNLKTVPCVVADDLNEEQIRAFRLADNKTAEIAGWDFHLLELELAKITELDMEAFGFKESEAVDIDDFFKQKNRVEKEEQPHIITCPYCGEMISLTKDFCIIEDENE